MTRDEALGVVRRPTAGLAPDQAGCSRLLERIAGHDDAEALRDALVLVGAERVLDQQGEP
jgi:hypothetical protein